MVSGAYKSRSKRRVFVKMPGGKTKVMYKDRAPSKSKCSLCGDVLKGVARVKACVLGRIPKTCKRPSRPYGGCLCSKCSRKKLIERVKE